MTVRWQTYDHVEDTDYRRPTDKWPLRTETGGKNRGPPFYFTTETGVYVLALENDNYYVGLSHELKQRITDHFIGEGAYWTQRHPPHHVVEVYDGTDDDTDELYRVERRKTARYMDEHGVESVRGGPWVHTDPDEWPPLPPDVQDTSRVDQMDELQSIADNVW